MRSAGKLEVALDFASLFVRRKWFNLAAPSLDLPTIATLLFEIYRQQSGGLLLSKKDAMKVMGVEHLATAQKYVSFLEDFGAVKIARSTLDARVDLLIPTDKGIELIREELERVLADFERMGAQFETGKPEARRRDLDVLMLLTEELGPSELSSTLSSMGEGEKRVLLLSETLKHMPNNRRARIERARWNSMLGRCEEAATDLSKCSTSTDPIVNKLADLIYRGRCYQRHEQYDKSLELLTRAIDLIKAEMVRPGRARLVEFLPDTYVDRGRVYEATGALTSATKDYREAVKLDPKHRARDDLERVRRQPKTEKRHSKHHS